MIYSKLTSTAPHDNGDGTFSAVLLDRVSYGSMGLLLQVALPVGPEAEPAGGRFFMLRCVDDTPGARHTDWSIYPRRPLFVAGSPVAHSETNGVRWTFFAPADDPQAIAWLQARARSIPA